MAKQLEQLEGFTPQELSDLTDKCVDFTEMFCDRRFYPYQRPFSEAIVRDLLAGLANTVTGLFARQSGKSETVANTASAMMVLLPKLANIRNEDNLYLFPQLSKFRKGLYVGIFSPSNFQSATTYGRLRERFTAPEARLFLDSDEFAKEGFDSLLPFSKNSGDEFALNNGSRCIMMSADRQSRIESKTFHLLLLDEAQDLDEFVVYKSVMPMGAHTNASTVATGTPGTTKGFFYKMIQNNKADQIKRDRGDRRMQPYLHFENDYKKVQRYQPNYKKYIIKEKRKIGEDSDEFQMAYCLKWLLERGMAVPQHLFDELCDKGLEVFTSYNETDLVAGLDWGKNSDSTILTIGKPLWEELDHQGRVPIQIISWWEKVGDDYEAIFAGVKEQLSRFSVKTIACDATGSGEPLVDRLAWEVPHINVIPVKFSSQSKDHLYKYFLLMLHERKVSWPSSSSVRNRKYFKKFEYEMTNLQKEHKGQYLTCHAPEDQKNAHDDYPDSLALMLWCLNTMAMPTIEISTADFYSGRNWHNLQGGNSFLRGSLK